MELEKILFVSNIKKKSSIELMDEFESTTDGLHNYDTLVFGKIINLQDEEIGDNPIYDISLYGRKSMEKDVDIVLSMTTREKLYTNIASYSSSVSTMLILDMLFSCYFHQNFDQHLNHKREVAKSYEPNRKASQKIMEEDENIVFKY